jgi:hypothetical protein
VLRVAVASCFSRPGSNRCSIVSTAPWLITLSRHKNWTFTIAGLLIAANFVYVFRIAPKMQAAGQSCPVDQPNACGPASRMSRFDGFDPETYRILRGEPNILDEKLRALDRLAQVGLSVTLVPAIERGVNEHDVGKIVEFAIQHPAVLGINFQPAFHAGRHVQHDPMKRMTIPDIVKLIEEQTAGKSMASDFVPVPCCFPTCNSVTYAFIEGDKVTPLPRILNVYDYLDYITNRVMPDFSLEVKKALEGLWSSSSVPGSEKSTQQFAFSCQACGIPESATIGELADHMLMIMRRTSWTPGHSTRRT